MIKTSCQWCAFRDGKDCKMGLYPKFGDKVTFENGYGIVDGVCMYRKTDEWTEGRDDPVRDNLDEIKTPITFVVLHNGNMDDLHTTIDSIADCHVIVAVDDAGNNSDTLTIFNMLKESNPSRYNVVGVYDKDNFESLFAESFRRVKNGYCILVNAGFTVPENWVQDLNVFVNYGQNIVLGILPVDDINGLTVYSTVFRLLRGNRGGHFFAKLVDEGGQDYIKSWSDIC